MIIPHYLPVFILNAGLHLLSDQDPKSMIPVMESIVFYLDKCQPLHF